MSEKFNLISQLYEKTAQDVVASADAWRAFLRAACNNYKLRFDEQLLIFAQKPDATAVLEIERWNKMFGRWVNRGAHGIAVFEDADRSKQRLIYYFDISDTHESEISKPVPIGKMKLEYTEDVIGTLGNTFGKLEHADTLDMAVLSASQNAVEDNLENYTEDLITVLSSDSLENTREDHVKNTYRQLVTNSVAYMVMTRLGIDAEKHFDTEAFRGVTEFNTPETLNSLGFATSDIAKIELTSIFRTINTLEKQNRTFAQSKDNDYNIDRENNGRSFDNEQNKLHNAGRLQSSELEDARTTGDEFRQIRSDEKGISQKSPQSPLLQPPDELQTDRAFGGNRAESIGDGRNSDSSDVGAGRDHGEPESDGYDAVGSENEQFEKSSRGNNSSRFDLQLSNHDFNRGGSGVEYFFQDKEKNELIKSFLASHKKEIAMFYRSHSDSKERSDFIMSFFNSEPYKTTLKSGITAGFEAYSDAIRLWIGNSGETPEREAWEKWFQIEDSILGMILLEEWIEPVKPLLPSNQMQIEFLGTKLKDYAILPLPQAAVDYILSAGSSFSEGKMRIFEHFTKNLSKADNIRFLKDEYGSGGHSDAIPGSGFWESHSSKGIEISDTYSMPERRVLLKWDYVAKRISELIRLDRYLNPKEKEYYSVWLEKQNQTESAKISVNDNPIRQPYREYLEVKNENLESIVFYQVGDFFEAYNDDAKKVADSLDLMMTSRPISDNDRVHLVGLPKHALETHITMLTDRGFDVAISAFENGERKLYNLVSQNKEDPVESKPIGRIEYLHTEYSDKAIDYNSVPTITCEWSESSVFEDGKTYSIAEFDSLMKNADAERAAGSKAAIEKYGSAEAWYNSDVEDEYTQYYGYDKVKFTLNMPDGRTFTERQDIGDGDGGVIEFLSKYPKYNEIIPILEKTVADLSASPQEHDLTYNTERTEKTSVSVAPILEQSRKSRVQSFDLHPEIPTAERHTFDLASHEIEEVNKKERFHRNFVAIKVLKDCENENRFATPEEQTILSKYVGWGGIPEVFDAGADSWKNEYVMLKSILTPEEYASARESTLTAFYTPPTVIEAVYKIMKRLGFREGNILEPSCGIGHFIGMLPESMSESKFYGVELDTISAGIAQQLYQKSSIAAQPFEEANLPDSFFDAVVGNVPFGDFKVLDKRYDKHKFHIHDYFFAKSLDKLRPGGVMALITSKGTMDKENPSVRKYIAQRAELLGAIRLPNNTFKGNAGTEVVSDILILQKRDRLIDIEPDWVHLGKDENGIKMNSYFALHPEMILGEMKMVSGRFGAEASCVPYENADLSEQLNEAVANIHGEITDYEVDEDLDVEDRSIPADPTVRNFSYTVLDDTLYFRENSRMSPVEVSATAETRIKGMIGIRDCVRNLIELQTDDYPDSEIKAEQEKLNKLYDAFTAKYGLINSRANTSAFSQDSSFTLLSALEILDDEGNLERKADMFFKRTIKSHTPVTSVDTSSEALAVSMGEKARIDMEYMMQLSGKTEEEIYQELKGVIFLNPMYGYGNINEAKYLMADEYLSGNVRKKLALARTSAQLSPEDYTINVEALEKVQPKDLTASEISVRLGATWLSPEIVEQFVYEFLGTPKFMQKDIKVNFSEYTGEWNVAGKSCDIGNVKAYSTYGTKRINAYKIIEETLNLKDVRIFDYFEDDEGKKKAVLNKKETAIALSKQELIKHGFEDWIWANPERREHLTKLYNEKFNSIRPREFDGSHITFNGMNPEIKLREHQRNAVAHILYGGNTLLAHAVGAGKTFEMTAAAMESKRLGLCNKSLFVVPNHLTEQWASEFLQLYPSANILVATKKDFETKNRKRFCGRIATGDYDAIIIGHSQFEKIPMSVERQRAILEQQLDEITMGIADLKRNHEDNFSVKQLERTKKSVKQRLDKLNDQSRKDDVVTFEELGVDRLFIDESHYYKNLFLYTKMRNVGGIAQTEAKKSSDLFMKCRYLDEITGGRGIVFATGTPISNSMVELYTIQRYLQYNTLVKNNLQHFDAWASTFGETVTAVELTPEGTGYRAKTRFARFYNLPELMSMFKEVADIKTADTLNLPVPKANFHNVAVKPSDIQKQMVEDLANRAEQVRNGDIDASIDNMLKITNDGRKLALDQRLINPMLPDFEGSKLNACVDNIYRIWQEGKEKYSAQLFFCDLSTPKNDGNFSVYDDIRGKLIERGIPADEIKFIHEADTEAKKMELFKKVRKGEVRILMGSTQKMGAGTNVQNKLIALHDLDCPWRPSDLEQRLGRIVRQGNENLEVDIYRYVTEETFDAYLYQLVESKQKFASQIMTSKSPVRSCEDIDETALSYAEIKMLATGNPYIKEKMDLDIQVQKLRLLKSNFLSEKYALEDKIIKFYPNEIARQAAIVEGLKSDVERVKEHLKPLNDTFVGMTVLGVFYTEKADAGKAIIDACKAMKKPDPVPLGEYRGFQMELYIESSEYKIKLKGELGYPVTLGEDTFGNITRCDNVLEGLSKRLEIYEQELDNIKKQFETAKIDVKKPFVQEEELSTKTSRLNELNALLNVNKRESEIVGGEITDAPAILKPKDKEPKRERI